MSLISRGSRKTSALLIGVAGVSIAVGAMAGACALPGYSLGGGETGGGAGGAGTGGSMSSATAGDGGAGGGGTGTGGMGVGGTGGASDGTCVKATDCGPPPPCRLFTCSPAGKCELMQGPDGVYPKEDQWNQPGDCNHAQCSGGKIIYKEDPSDKPLDDGQSCTHDICEGPYIDHSSFGTATACQLNDVGMIAGKCDMDGNCVECVDADPACNGCMSGQCAADPSCFNQETDNGETDVDCGGPCYPCNTGLECTADAHCWSGKCANGKCAAPSCIDGLRNGEESDIDCGIACMKPCKTGKRCLGDVDCKSGLCKNFACQFTCGDGAQTGLEEGKDCGGPICPKCGL